MRYRFMACVLSAALTIARAGVAQDAPKPAESELIPPPDWAFSDLACAPQLDVVKKGEARRNPVLRVIGSQDTSIRDLLGPGDTLVISGGSNAGLESGQRYYVRRRVTTRGGDGRVPATIHTAGWVQILGVDTNMATATVVHACDGFLLDDYLEPYTAPTIAARPIPGDTPHYENMGHIVTGPMGLTTTAPGQITTIDRGSNAGVVVGQRFLVFRDRRTLRVETTGRSTVFESMEGRLPLVEVGQVLVVAVRPEDSTVQVVISKDAVTAGDMIAPIR
jgi:hypothetical protein